MELTRIPLHPLPHLFDRVIADIQRGLGALTWLDHIFGRCERLVKVIDGQRFYTPNWHAGGNEYILLAPDQHLGNFAFFVLSEPQTVQWQAGERSRLKAPFSLILWVDMRKVDDYGGRDTEYVKEQVLNLLNGRIWLREGSMEITRIYERAENVFQGFTLDEVDNLFLMSPFAGFRFEGTLSITNACI